VLGGEASLSTLVLVQAGKREVSRFGQLTDDSRWLTENYEQVRKDHAGEYVAVHKAHVVDHDEDLVKLRDRVKRSPVVIRYIYRKKPHLIL
jgi:hypothetical protein